MPTQGIQPGPGARPHARCWRCVVGCLLVLRPFLSALLWAAILSITTWPAYRSLRERARLPRAGPPA